MTNQGAPIKSLRAARWKLREAATEARDVEFDNEERVLLLHSIGEVRDELNRLAEGLS